MQRCRSACWHRPVSAVGGSALGALVVAGGLRRQSSSGIRPTAPAAVRPAAIVEHPRKHVPLSAAEERRFSRRVGSSCSPRCGATGRSARGPLPRLLCGRARRGPIGRPERCRSLRTRCAPPAGTSPTPWSARSVSMSWSCRPTRDGPLAYRLTSFVAPGRQARLARRRLVGREHGCGRFRGGAAARSPRLGRRRGGADPRSPRRHDRALLGADPLRVPARCACLPSRDLPQSRRAERRMRRG